MGKVYYYLENSAKINENAPLIDDGSAHSTDVPQITHGVSESISSIMDNGATEGELAPQPALKDTLNLDVKDGMAIRTAFGKKITRKRRSLSATTPKRFSSMRILTVKCGWR